MQKDTYWKRRKTGVIYAFIGEVLNDKCTRTVRMFPLRKGYKMTRIWDQTVERTFDRATENEFLSDLA